MIIDVIICVDQGLDAGAAAIRPFERKPFLFAVARTAQERRELLVAALEGSDVRKAWLVLENHAGMPLTRGTRHDVKTREKGADGSRSTASVLGMGASAGRWKEQAELLGIPKSHMTSVTPEDWKRAIFGKKAPSMETTSFRQMSVLWATNWVGQSVTHDVAAAIAMAVHQASQLPLSLGLEPGKVAG